MPITAEELRYMTDNFNMFNMVDKILIKHVANATKVIKERAMDGYYNCDYSIDYSELIFDYKSALLENSFIHNISKEFPDIKVGVSNRLSDGSTVVYVFHWNL